MNQYPKESRDNRLKAISEGKKTYEGTPCKKCGSTQKHVSSYSCVTCNVKRNLYKLYDKNLMEKYRTKDKVALYWQKNLEKAKAIDDRYNQSEKGKISNSIKSSKRRARIKNQVPDSADFDIIRSIYERCKIISEETGIPHEVDHIVPISKGGLHHQDNLRIITKSENRKKGNKLL